MNKTENNPESRVELSQADQADLLRLCREIYASLNLEECLLKLSEHLKQTLKLDRVDVIILELSTLAARYGDGKSNIPQKLTSQVITGGKGLAGKAYRTRQIVTTTNYWSDPEVEHTAELDEQVRRVEGVALITIPVLFNHEVTAIIAGIKKQAYRWTHRNLSMAYYIAEFAATGINNAQLHHNLEVSYQKLEARTAELEKYMQELEARTLELETLQRFNRDLRGTLDLEELAKRAVYLASQVLYTDYGALYLTDSADPEQLNLLGGFEQPDDNSRSLEAGKWINAKKSQEISCWPKQIRLDQGLTGKCVRLGQTMRIENLTEELKKNPTVTLAQKINWQSALFIPLWLGEKIIGTLNLVAITPRQFSEFQIHFAEMIAAQIAAAVQYVRQIETEHQKKELAAALALARTAAHELNQPLTVLQGEVDLALQFGRMLDSASLEHMEQAISLLAERVQAYQHIVRVETIEAVQGITILDPNKSIQN